MFKRNSYICLMSILESLKHIDRHRSKYKLIRAFVYWKYLFISYCENIIISAIDINECRLREHHKTKVVASLTSFPKRINGVENAIKSIMLQTVQPDRVILWLADSQFPNKQLPENLKALMNVGLEVRYCEDLRPHKKYYYCLQEQLDDELVITFDDDLIYHPHTIEYLIKKHEEYPSCIVCSQVLRITSDGKGGIMPYDSWMGLCDGHEPPHPLNTPLTGSGCLYPKGLMPKETYNKENIFKMALNTDDLWIYVMSKLSGINIVSPDKVARTFTTITKTQQVHLAQFNCIQNGNDDVFNTLLQYYSKSRDFIIRGVQESES